MPLRELFGGRRVQGVLGALTKREALKEVRRRYRYRGFMYSIGRGKARYCMVGYCNGFRDVVLGGGRTYEEAFAQADQTPIDPSQPHWWSWGPDGDKPPHPVREHLTRFEEWRKLLLDRALGVKA